jgi:hypothetical protein
MFVVKEPGRWVGVVIAVDRNGNRGKKNGEAAAQDHSHTALRERVPD